MLISSTLAGVTFISSSPSARVSRESLLGAALQGYAFIILMFEKSSSAFKRSSTASKIVSILIELIAGDGADFDYWDSLDYFFEDYDSLGLRFELLDTLKL